MAEEIGLFEAMHTQRAIRYFKPDPVPDELVRKILEAAVHAPSGANRQQWAFVVIRDAEIRRKIAELYLSVPGPQITSDMPRQDRRIFRGAAHLVEHLHEVPVLILACIRHDGSPGDLSTGSSIFPAVQNILLAARGLGLGSVLTTRHKGFKDKLKALLDMPENVEMAALLPTGYPAEGSGYGPTNRLPLEKVAFYDRWGNS